ncbi:MAG: branched-chain-amino-acid transaminase, partial [Acidimicrobiaceae bacterium]|nr:branched-chain-amino-acid transaminase [Acidimicrobiaceae bacterium]
MPITPTEKIWMDGELVDWGDAKVHVLTHSLHYGLGVFEGIRAYPTSSGPAVFRLTDHIRRLFDSAKIFMIDIPFSFEAIIEATKDVVRVNGLPEGYIRPIVYLGYGEMGLNPLFSEVKVSIATWPWGAYLGEEGLERGVSMKISSWQRHGPNALPPAAKGTGMYINSSMAKVEAIKAGYDEAILLSPQGYVSE